MPPSWLNKRAYTAKCAASEHEEEKWRTNRPCTQSETKLFHFIHFLCFLACTCSRPHTAHKITTRAYVCVRVCVCGYTSVLYSCDCSIVCISLGICVHGLHTHMHIQHAIVHPFPIHFSLLVFISCHTFCTFFSHRDDDSGWTGSDNWNEREKLERWATQTGRK